MPGVLVSVSVTAVVYTRILVSDRISACPYRSFSRIYVYYLIFLPMVMHTGMHRKLMNTFENWLIEPPFLFMFMSASLHPD